MSQIWTLYNYELFTGIFVSSFLNFIGQCSAMGNGEFY